MVTPVVQSPAEGTVLTLVRDETLKEQLEGLAETIIMSEEWRELARVPRDMKVIPSMVDSLQHSAAAYLTRTSILTSSMFTDPSYSGPWLGDDNDEEATVLQATRDRLPAVILEFKINGEKRTIALTHDAAWSMMEMTLLSAANFDVPFDSLPERVLLALRSAALPPLVGFFSNACGSGQLKSSMMRLLSGRERQLWGSRLFSETPSDPRRLRTPSPRHFAQEEGEEPTLITRIHVTCEMSETDQ